MTTDLHRLRMAVAHAAGLLTILLVAGLVVPPSVRALEVDPGTASDPAAPEFQSAATCGYCHDQMYAEFSSDMHAQAVADPLYRWEVALANEQTDGEIGPFCLKCHAPIGHMRGEIHLRGAGPPPGAVDGDELSGVAREGVICDFCHTVDGKGEGWPGNASFSSKPGLVKRGPLEDAESPGHETAMSDFHESADFCGMCHDAIHPTSGVPLEATFSEWKEGPYAEEGVTCQDCHMTPGPGPSAPPPGRAAIFGPEREAVRLMTFTGGNTVWGDAERARERLQAAAEIEVRVDAPEEVEPGDHVETTVVVRNVGAGHYIPTGLTNVRQMWLELGAEGTEDAAGTGGGGDALVPLGEVRYGTEFADADGNHDDVHPWFAASIHSDNRIPPRGESVEEFSFEWPEGLEGDGRMVAQLKYMSFSQELADKADLGIEVPVVKMAEAQVQVVTDQGGWFPLALGIAGAALILAGLAFLVVRRSGRL